jgi:7-cyano-7-deazaguanine synthase
MKELCVISMSGGLDSTTLAYKAIEDGYSILPINIKYGQKNEVERIAFQKVFEDLRKKYPDQILDYIDLDLEGLLKTSLALYQKIRDSKQVEEATDLEFYTPSRNLVFSTLASMIGEIAAIASGLKSIKVGLGVHKHETYKNYWDITPTFVEKLNEVFALNDAINVSMYAPYASFTKVDIVKDALRMGVPYELTWTCYNPIFVKDSYLPCHVCEACVERQRAGELAGCKTINDYGVYLD